MAFSTHRSVLRRFCAPSLLLLCSLPCLPALAQNSGGGWVSYQVPNPPPYVPGAALDWTGLTVSSTTVKNDGSSTSSAFQSYVSYFTIGDNVGANTNQSIMYSVTGPSTYKWNWTPTGSNAGAPAPPLYVLAQATGGASLGANNAGHTSGLSGSATFNFASSVPAFSYGPLATVTQYQVMPASGGAAASVGVNPTLTATVSGSPAGDEGYSSVFVSTAAFPITLASPDPMGRPDLGDGSNQYTYETSRPDGQLTVPASVYVPGTSTPDTTFLLPHVALSVSPKMQTGAQPFVWTASDAGMFVNTTSTRPGYSSPWPTGDFCYIGLPPNNSYFGNHTMTMLVDGTASQTANYQLFFTGTASNWPGSDSVTPNWYYYYNQVYPAPGDYANIPQAGLTEVVFTPGSTNPETWGITQFIGNGVASVPMHKQVFILGTATGNNPRLIQNPRIGDLQIGGIYSFIEACRHEVAHRALLLNGEHVPYRDEDGPPYGITDSDGDHIPDNVEAKYHLDPENADTTGYYGNTEDPNNLGKGDVECLADIQGLGAVIQNEGLWTEDWCDFGLQMGKRPPFGNTQYLGAFFPWRFDPYDTSQPSSVTIPSNALTSWDSLTGTH